MARQIALLRGINVGGHRRVPMAELRELLTAQGYGDVVTHLQSGNVVLTSDAAPAQLERDLEQQILDGMGVDPRVLVRTRDELASVIDRNPLGELVTDTKRFQVSFLAGELAPEAAERLATTDVAPDLVVVSGREIYSWHPDGIGNSRIGQAFSERRLGVSATARNWNTVTKLLELADR